MKTRPHTHNTNDVHVVAMEWACFLLAAPPSDLRVGSDKHQPDSPENSRPRFACVLRFLCRLLPLEPASIYACSRSNAHTSRPYIYITTGRANPFRPAGPLVGQGKAAGKGAETCFQAVTGTARPGLWPLTQHFLDLEKVRVLYKQTLGSATCLPSARWQGVNSSWSRDACQPKTRT